VLRRLVGFASSFLPFLLSGCGIVNLCNNHCDSPLVHDSFCHCVDWTKVNNPGTLPPTAGCVCQYSSGVVGAWFPYQPVVYPTTNQNLTIFASGCSDLAVCEAVGVGEGADQYTYLTGRITIKPTSWLRSDNIWNGASVWTLFGRLVQNHATLEDNYTPTRLHPDAFLKSMLRAVENVDFANTIEGCRAACSAASPYCINVKLNDSQTTSLKGFYGLLSGRPSTISSTALLSLFDLNSDPCNRADTSISNGQIVNKGDACRLTASAPGLAVSASLEIPAVLSGKLNFSEHFISTEFPDPETRGRLTFSDSDLEADWGGEVKGAYIDDNGAGFSVGDKSCVRVPLQ
jgi:hypothetical protein